MVRRGVVTEGGLFDDPLGFSPPAAAAHGLGKGWREIAPRFWVFDCKDGSRVALDGARYLILKPGAKK